MHSMFSTFGDAAETEQKKRDEIRLVSNVLREVVMLADC